MNQVHKIRAPDTIMRLTKPHAKSHCISKAKFSISLLFYAYLSRVVTSPLGSHHFHTDLWLPSLLHARYMSHLCHLPLITLNTQGERHKLWHSPSVILLTTILLQPSVTKSAQHLFSHAHSQCSHIRVTVQVSQPLETRDKSVFKPASNNITLSDNDHPMPKCQ